MLRNNLTYLILVLTLLFNVAHAQIGEGYKSSWDKIDSLIKMRKPRSVFAEADKIYQRAKKEKNYFEQIRALSVKTDFAERASKEGMPKYLTTLDKELKAMPFPYSAIMHSFIADSYKNYLQNHSYRIRKRDKGPHNNKDIESWDIDDYVNKIVYHFSESLKNSKDFRKLKLEEYSRIFHSFNKDKKDESLYELLAHNAIGFYFGDTYMIRDYGYGLKNKLFFMPAKEFIDIDIKPFKKDLLKYKGLHTLQDLMRYVLKTRSKEALTRSELYRIRKINSKYKGDGKSKLYINAHKYLENNFNNKEIAKVWFSHAQHLYDNSNEVMGCKAEEKNYNYRKQAKKLCNKCITTYNETPAAKKCSNLLKMIESKEVRLKVESIVPSKKIFPLHVTYRNTDKLWVRIWKPAKKASRNRWYDKGDKNALKGAKLVSTQIFKLNGGHDHNNHTTELLLKGLDYGNYIVEVSAEQQHPSRKYSLGIFSVSNLTYMQKSTDKGTRIMVLDRVTGQSVNDFGIKYWRTKWSRGKDKIIDQGEKKSDSDGVIHIEDNEGSLSFRIFRGKDTLQGGRIYPHYGHKVAELTYTNIFSDRMIYRPGDKVHFKAIAYTGKKYEYELKTNAKLKVELLDANRQKISEKDLTTNEYGSISGSFDIPYNVLTGFCTIKIGNQGHYMFKVEEYKAPKFEVTSEIPEKQYKFNDEVNISAKALTFNKVPVSDSQFEYRVYRKRYSLWRPWMHGSYMGNPIFTGVGTTDKEGNIKFSFKALPFDDQQKNQAVSYTYEISVTDINGETQKVKKSIKVSQLSLFIKAELEEILSTEQLSKGIVFNAKNINGKDIPANIEVELIKIEGPDKALIAKPWGKTSCPIYTKEEWSKLYPGYVYADEDKLKNFLVKEKVGTYNLNTAESNKLVIPENNMPKAGTYVIKAVAKDKDGKEVNFTKPFVVYETKSKSNPYKTVLWSDCSNKKAEPGEIIKYTLGSSKDIKVVFELYGGGKLIKSENIRLKDEQKTIKIPVKESYRGGISIQMYAFSENRKYSKNTKIEVPFTNKNLDISIKSFRDKLLPGEKEMWTVTIKDWKKKNIDAEMLATLYDASLDKLEKNDWFIDIYSGSAYVPVWRFSSSYLDHGYYINREQQEFYKNIRTLSNDFFWRRNISRYGVYGDLASGFAGKISGKIGWQTAGSPVGEEVPVVAFGCTKKNSVTGSISTPRVQYDAVDEENFYIRGITPRRVPELETSGIKVRKNFAKTAFFYPFLRTNSKGELEISFTVPESLTKWKMMGLAHTKELSFGTIEKYLVTKKDLMVNTNTPRFLREGDKIVFTTKLSNLSEKELSGGVKLELHNAITGEALDISEDESAKIFKVESKENTLVSWTINIPSKLNLIKYTITATNGKYSDAESSLIPVLSKRIMVSKSMPFSVKTAGESTLIVPDLKNIFKKKTVEPYRMTMEFASNPVWYAVQSLPYLIEYPYECSEQIFAKLFANTLATHIINSNPKIREIYDVWKKEKGTSKERFLSKLQQNKELKNIIIQETPWLAEAKSHEERAKRLSMIFDLNNMAREYQRTSKKLFDTQNSDGGWPWFKDMPSNRFITQHILAGLGYLSKISGKKPDQYQTNRALNWVKTEFIKSYMDNKDKAKPDKRLSFIDLHYLYTTSFYKKVKYTQEEKLIVDYHINQCKKYWKDASLYNKGLAALVLYRNGYESDAKDIVASLKEYASNDSYYGMYWKENIGGMFVHKAQIETHSLMIEVFSEITNDTRAVKDMKIWLLNHKRTNSWESTKATVCAVYSLLAGRDDSFDMDPELKVSVGRKQIFDASKPENIIEAGTGYVKKVYGKEEISRDMDNIKVSKSTDKLMWGALYLQYFDDIDKVMESSTGLKIDKTIVVERLVDGKLSLEELKEGTALEVGQKLKVILSISNDFPMEYVHIKDLRASSLEPGFVKSGYKYGKGLRYYLAVKDASVNYFIDYLPKGKYTLSYNLRVTHKGKYSNGISTIQCMYAPEYQSNSKGETIEIK